MSKIISHIETSKDSIQIYTAPLLKLQKIKNIVIPLGNLERKKNVILCMKCQRDVVYLTINIYIYIQHAYL